jgi:hypothetical protein
VYLSQQDQSLYDFFKEKSASLASGAKIGHAAVTSSDNYQSGGIIRLLNFLRSICNHGEQLLPETALNVWNTRDKPFSTPGEVTMRNNNDDSPRYSAKVLALLRNLVAAHTATHNVDGIYIPAKR